MNVPRSEDRFRAIVAVHVLLLRNSGREVLLLRRYNTGYADGQYSFVAGHLDGHEPVVTAATREAREEVGIEIADADITVIGVMHRRLNDERIDFFVAAEQWSGDLSNAEPDKCDELRWALVDALPDNVIPYIRRAIENYRDERWFDSFGWT